MVTLAATDILRPKITVLFAHIVANKVNVVRCQKHIQEFAGRRHLDIWSHSKVLQVTYLYVVLRTSRWAALA